MSPHVYGSNNSRDMPDGSRRYIIKVKIMIYIRLAEAQITIGRHFLFCSRSSCPVGIVCYTAVFSVVTQRSSPLVGGALRDDTKNCCVADYMFGRLECNSLKPLRFGKNQNFYP